MFLHLHRELRQGQETIEQFSREMLDRHGFRLSQVTEGAEEKDLFTFVSDMVGKQHYRCCHCDLMPFAQVLAGVETSSYTTAFLLYHLSKSPREQQLLRTECARACAGEVVSMKELRRCKMALKESLRLNPVSVGVGRISQADGVFAGRDSVETPRWKMTWS